MKDEIKEILDKLEIVARKHTIEVCDDGSKIETMPASVIDELRLNNYSAKLLLDYITNLQEELKSANESITWYSNRFKAVERDNERLKEKIEHYEKTQTFGDYVKEVNLLVDYIQRNKKTIEYINKLLKSDDIPLVDVILTTIKEKLGGEE